MVFLLKIPKSQRGGGGSQEGRGGRGQEGVCREFGGGWGAKYFFGGRNSHQVADPNSGNRDSEGRSSEGRENPHWDSPRDRGSEARDSEVRDSEARNSESRDSEARHSENRQIHAPP